MRAPLSIVIPTLNAQGQLRGCLSALGEGLEAGLIREVIFTDGGSTDDTQIIAQEAGVVLISGASGRGRQLRAGADAAAGDWILFLHSDSWLQAGWSGHVLDHIATSEDAGVFRLAFRSKDVAARVVSGWANFRTRIFGLPYGDQGLLIARKHYDRVGGYQPVALMEDVAIARALRGALVVLPGVAETSAKKYEEEGWMRRSLGNISILIRYYFGADPAELARAYGRRH